MTLENVRLSLAEALKTFGFLAVTERGHAVFVNFPRGPSPLVTITLCIQFASDGTFKRLVSAEHGSYEVTQADHLSRWLNDELDQLNEKLALQRKFKVFGTRLMLKAGGEYKQRRVIVAAPTKKRAMELFGLKPHQAQSFMTQTHNEAECEIALAKPESVFYAADGDWGKDFKPL